MTKKPTNNQYVDLVISEVESGKASGNFKFCTLSKSRGQRTINLRLPDEVQDKILSAYQNGKAVRIFA